MSMKNEHIDHLLPQYLEGILSQGESEIVEIHLRECKACGKELEEYRQLLNNLDREMEIKPSDGQVHRFQEMLNGEKREKAHFVKTEPRNTWVLKALRIAAGIALLISGYLFGSYQKGVQTSLAIAALNERNMGMQQTTMLSLMENRSASRRIQGVNYIEGLSSPNKDILRALTERMLNDENANVRLTAVNAVAGFSGSKMVREGLIRSLETESDPNIQIAVIQALVRIRDKNAVAPMKQLMDREDTAPFVKEQIRSLIPSII